MNMSQLSLLSVLVCFCCSQVVTSQDPMIIQSPQNKSICEGGTVNFTCIVMFTSASPGPATWFTNNGNNDANGLPGHTRTDDSDGQSAPANVTTVLTVTNVSISDNGADYFCAQGVNRLSDTVYLTVYAIPTEPTITVTPLSNTSFMIKWISDASFNYIVTWTNLNSLMMSSSSVLQNTNNYTVMDLSDNANYNVSVAVMNMCKNDTSRNITVYAEPNKPQFTQCVSYKNGQPALEVLSFVTVDAPRMSSQLTFSASYQSGNSSNSNSQLVECAMQSNCTAEFAVDITPPVTIIKSVEVTVNGTYGCNTSEPMEDNITVRAIRAVSATVNSTAATLECELPCLSPNLRCSLFNIAPNDSEVMIVNSAIMGSLMSYSYPTQQIMISNLTENTTYTYYVVAMDTTNMIEVGEVCGSFKTEPTDGDESDGNRTDPSSGTSSKGSNAAAIGGGVAGGVVAVIAVGIGICVVYMLCCRNKDRDDSDKQELRSPTTTSGSHTASVQPASNVQPTSSVPHQATASGEEYAVTSKVVTKPQQQQPPEEYAMVDKTKKHAAAAQGIHYADLQALPSSGDKPPPNQGPSTYAMVA